MNAIIWSSHQEKLVSGQRRPVFCGALPIFFPGSCLAMELKPLPAVGYTLTGQDQGAGLQIVGKFRWPAESTGSSCIEGGWVQALDDMLLDVHSQSFRVERKGYSLAWITLSDKGYTGRREDQAGPLIADLVGQSLSLSLSQGFLLPDDPRRLRSLLVELALEQGFDMVVTTGGTGVAPRDLTPETTLSVIEKRLPGMETAMLQTSLRHTGNALISRAVVGTLGESLLINLPGSPKAVRENLAVLLPALAHTLAKLQGDPSDCAQAETNHKHPNCSA
jgi:molybdopterin adenylyltransferase